MKFGEMIERLKKGDIVIARRQDWDGTIAYMPPKLLRADEVTSRTAALFRVIERTVLDEPLQVEGFFAVYTTKGAWQPGWTPNQADMLAEDWEIVGG